MLYGQPTIFSIAQHVKMSFRIKLIEKLININENLFFYPNLKRIYKDITSSPSDLLIIFDVGANKGQSIDFFSKLSVRSHIFAFEPNPKLFKYLKNKYSSRQDITLNKLGISNVNGQLELNETVTDLTSTFEELNYQSKYLEYKATVLGVKKENIIKSKYLVTVTSLSNYIRLNSIKKIDILKLDVEGHELNCLLGLFDADQINVEYIQFESHNDDMYVNKKSQVEIQFLLKKNGFKLFGKIKHGFGDFYEVIYRKSDLSD